MDGSIHLVLSGGCFFLYLEHVAHAACGNDSRDEVWHNGQVLAVPDGCFYVREDNAEDSFDLRYWEEPFAEEDVVAVVVWKVK